MKNHSVELKFGKVSYLETVRPRLIHKFAADPETIMKGRKFADQALRATTLFICPDTRLERFGTQGTMLPSMTWTHVGKLSTSDTERAYTGNIIRDFVWGPAAVYLAYSGFPWVARIVDEGIRVVHSRVTHTIEVPTKGAKLGFGSKGVPREFQNTELGNLAYGLEKYSPNTKKAAAVLRSFSEMCMDFTQSEMREASERVGELALRLKKAKDEGLRLELWRELDAAKEFKGRLLPDEAAWARRFGLKPHLSGHQCFLTQFNYTINGGIVEKVLSSRYQNPAVAEKYPNKTLVLWFELDPSQLRHGNRDSRHAIYALTKIDGVKGVFPQVLPFDGPKYLGVDDDGKEIAQQKRQ